MNKIWQILEIAKTADTSTIRKAYAKLVSIYQPEDHPQEFLQIREAYEAAMHYANSVAASEQANNSEISGSQEEDAQAGNRLTEDAQESEGLDLFGEERQTTAKTGWTFDPDKEHETNAFNDGEAIKEFLALYLSKNRADRNLWTKYFSSELFLDVFMEAGFAKLLQQEVEKNLQEYPPHKNFFIALSLAYALAKPRYEMEDVFFQQSFANFDGVEHIQAIAAKGPQLHNVKGTDLAILNGYRDYFSLLHVTKQGEWNDRISSQFNELMWRYGSSYIKDKVPPSSGYEPSDYIHRHPSCLKLLAHVLSVIPLPAQAYSLVRKCKAHSPIPSL